jgi:hypothetical protein
MPTVKQRGFNISNMSLVHGRALATPFVKDRDYRKLSLDAPNSIEILR